MVVAQTPTVKSSSSTTMLLLPNLRFTNFLRMIIWSFFIQYNIGFHSFLVTKHSLSELFSFLSMTYQTYYYSFLFFYFPILIFIPFPIKVNSINQTLTKTSFHLLFTSSSSEQFVLCMSYFETYLAWLKKVGGISILPSKL